LCLISWVGFVWRALPNALNEAGTITALRLHYCDVTTHDYTHTPHTRRRDLLPPDFFVGGVHRGSTTPLLRRYYYTAIKHSTELQRLELCCMEPHCHTGRRALPPPDFLVWRVYRGARGLGAGPHQRDAAELAAADPGARAVIFFSLVAVL
jgi:hypothetical protein